MEPSFSCPGFRVFHAIKIGTAFASTVSSGPGATAAFYCSRSQVGKDWARERVEGREMQDAGRDARYDFDRYRKLLAEAVDEKKRLAFIDLLVEERARDQLEAQRLADRKAMTVSTIARVLGTPRA
jgi:hypothetical protein